MPTTIKMYSPPASIAFNFMDGTFPFRSKFDRHNPAHDEICACIWCNSSYPLIWKRVQNALFILHRQHFPSGFEHPCIMQAFGSRIFIKDRIVLPVSYHQQLRTLAFVCLMSTGFSARQLSTRDRNGSVRLIKHAWLSSVEPPFKC